MAAALAVLASCGDRTHLTAGYGRSVQGAFARQAANPQAGRESRPLAGLDAQEASIVAGNYRRSLTAKGASSSDQNRGMVILAPSTEGGAQPYMPPPSVPEKQ